MKYEFLSHKALVGAIVVGSLVIGTTGMVYGINIDQKLQERDVEIKAQYNLKPLVDTDEITLNDGNLPKEILSNLEMVQDSDPISIANSLMTDKGNLASIESLKDESYKGYCKPILKSGEPSKDITISMEQAAYIGTKYVEKKTGKNLKGCQVEMYCNNVSVKYPWTQNASGI